MLIAWLKPYPITRLALDGAAAAAIGLSLFMGVTLARRVRRRVVPLCVMAATFLAVGVAHLPLFWVVAAGGIVSVAIEFTRLAKS
jgi:chromate transporter